MDKNRSRFLKIDLWIFGGFLSSSCRKAMDVILMENYNNPGQIIIMNSQTVLAEA